MRAINLFRGVPGALALTAILLSGCPSAEPPGNTLTCGPNTKEVDGKCVSTVDEAPCGEGASRNPDTGQCEPDVECGTGTTYNPVTQTCESDSKCGPGTTLNEATGVCEPDVVCGDDTTFDPDTGACLPNAVCGEGTRFDEASGECVPNENCGEGTHFDPETNTCQPDLVCGPGLTDVDGVCLSALDLIVTEADVEEPFPDDNDPAFGGTQEAVALEPIGERAVLAGRIDRPVDRNDDGDIDQDIDVWRFTGTQGQLLSIRVVTTGAFQPAFTLTGPNGYYREPQLGFSLDSSRDVVLPYDGEYDLTVLPSVILQGASEPLGGEDAIYAVIIEEVDWPAPATLTVPSDGTIVEVEGTVLGLRDNFVRLSAGASAPLLAGANVPSGGTVPALYLFNDARQLVQELRFRTTAGVDTAFGPTYLDTGAGLVAVLDWSVTDGIDSPFAITAQTVETAHIGTLPADGLIEHTTSFVPGLGGISFTLDAPAGQVLLAELGLSGEYALFGPDGALLHNGPIPNFDSIAYADQAGTYRWVVASTSSSDLNPHVVVQSFPAEAGGTIAAGERKTFSGDTVESGVYVSGKFILLENTDPLLLTLDFRRAFGLPNFDVYLLSPGGAVVSRQWLDENHNPTLHVLRPDAARTLVRIDPVSAGRIHDPDVLDWTVEVTAKAIPDWEVEPNNDLETATPLASVPTSVRGHIASGDVDVYTIALDTPLAPGELLEVTVDNVVPDTPARPTLRLHLNHAGPASSSNSFDDTQGLPGARMFITAADIPEEGPLAIGVSVSANAIDYVLDVRRISSAHDLEPNDSFAEANQLGTLDVTSAPVRIVGRAGSSHHDYFRFTLSEPVAEGNALRFSLRNVTRSSTLHFALYDDTEQLVINASDDDLTVLAAPAGTGPFYVHIRGGDSTWKEAYDLTIATMENVEPEPLVEETLPVPLPVLTAAAPVSRVGTGFPDDTDVFEFELDTPLEENEVISVRWRNVNLRGNNTVVLSDAADNVLAATYRYWGEIIARPDGTGPFYVSFTPGHSANTVPAVYSFELARIENDALLEVEPNNSTASAQALTLPVTVAGLAHDGIPSGSTPPDPDFFTFTLAEDLAPGEKLLVDGLVYFSNTRLAIRVLDAAGEELANVYTRDPSFEVELPVTTAGTSYFIEVNGDENLNSSQSLSYTEADSYELSLAIGVR